LLPLLVKEGWFVNWRWGGDDVNGDCVGWDPQILVFNPDSMIDSPIWRPTFVSRGSVPKFAQAHIPQYWGYTSNSFHRNVRDKPNIQEWMKLHLRHYLLYNTLATRYLCILAPWYLDISMLKPRHTPLHTLETFLSQHISFVLHMRLGKPAQRWYFD
jgi:hypothetical protein